MPEPDPNPRPGEPTPVSPAEAHLTRIQCRKRLAMDLEGLSVCSADELSARWTLDELLDSALDLLEVDG